MGLAAPFPNDCSEGRAVAARAAGATDWGNVGWPASGRLGRPRRLRKSWTMALDGPSGLELDCSSELTRCWGRFSMAASECMSCDGCIAGAVAVGVAQGIGALWS